MNPVTVRQDDHAQQKMDDVCQAVRRTIQGISGMPAALQKEFLFQAISGLLEPVEDLPAAAAPEAEGEVSRPPPEDCEALVDQVELEFGRATSFPNCSIPYNGINSSR